MESPLKRAESSKEGSSMFLWKKIVDQNTVIFVIVFIFLNLGHLNQEPSLLSQKQVPAGHFLELLNWTVAILHLKTPKHPLLTTCTLISLWWLWEVKQDNNQYTISESHGENAPLGFCSSSKSRYTSYGVKLTHKVVLVLDSHC